MRAVLYLCVCAWYSYVVMGQDINAMRDMPKYDARYDYLDIDAILDSKRLVRNYVECLINAQRCTPEGKALKRILPEALRTKCVRCTEKQKRTAVKVIKRIKYGYPEEWAKLASRWDPTGDFTRYFEEFLDKDHFNTIYESGNEIPGSSSLSPPPPPPMSTPPPMLTPPPPPMSTPPPPPPPRPVPPLQPEVDISTSPRPVILNRFGEDGELMMGSPSSMAGTTRPTMQPMPPMPPMPATMRPAAPPPSTMRPAPQPRPTPTQTMWAGAASDAMPTRFPLRPFQNMPPAYTTAITFIDQLGYKILRTTELVTDILRNTVRAVVG